MGNDHIVCICAGTQPALTVQVNSEAPAEPRYAIMRRLVDLCLDLEDYDYNADFLKEWYANATKRLKKRPRLPPKSS